MSNPSPLTDAELKALAYFAVGVTSEGSVAGRDQSFRLSFAGTVREGRMEPVGNSGYSFGKLQIDLGQHPDVAESLLDHYQRWARTQADHAALALKATERGDLLESLQRTGREMRAAGARDIDRAPLNRFLASDAGRTFVHALDTQRANGVTAVDAVRGNGDSALERLQRTALYRNASEDDQAKWAAPLMKLQNQSGVACTPGLLSRIERGTIASPDALKTAIDALLPNQRNGDPDYLQSGADNTLRGTALFNRLRAADADNPLSVAWGAVVANPLVGPVAAHVPNAANPHLGVQYDTVRSLYLTPERSQQLIQVLDDGTPLARGNPAVVNGRRSAGFYASGGDFVHWNQNGHGVACVDGRWRAVDPDALQRVANRDGSVELHLTENGRTTPLLRVEAPVRGRHASLDDDHDGTTVAAVDPARRTLLANDPMHTDFATYERIHAWVLGTGHWDGSQGRNVASALYLQQASDPTIRRVDMVSGGVGCDGAENVFAVYAPHGEKGPYFHAHVDGRIASQQPAQTSLEQAEAVIQQRATQSQKMDQVASIGPRIAV